VARENPELGTPADYADHHPSEHPGQWGWHADLGKAARIGGWISVIALLLMVTSTHYNSSGAAWLIGFAVAIAAGLVYDLNRRRTSWRR
jgi:hypothetical protein